MQKEDQSTTTAAEVAAHLLNVGAIRLRPDEPFTWSSGWKSPIYCDNRISLSFPETRSFIKTHLAELIKTKFPDCGAIAGVATAGIPQGALVADYLNLPFLYVRDKAKSHGMTNQIEGKVVPGQRVVLVEDLVSTGGSSLKAAEALRAGELQVDGLVAIFTYGFEVADKNFEEAGVTYHCLSNYAHLLNEASRRGIIQEKDIDLLQQWRNNPAEWGK